MVACFKAPGQVVDEVVRRYGPELHARARRITRDPDEAADLLQDALERALRFRGEVEAQALVPWIVTVMHNLFMDRCRRQGVVWRNLQAFGASREDGCVTPDDREEPSPPSSRVTRDTLRRAVERLDAPFRQVFELHERNLSLSEIGLALGIPATTAGTRLFRARRKLRALLEERGA